MVNSAILIEELEAMPDYSINRASDLRRDIVAQAREIGSRAEDITDKEIEEIVDEAFDNVRDRRVRFTLD